MGYTSVVSPRLCYKITPNGGSSWSLTSLCQSEGGRLVVLNSQEKQEYMASLQRHDDVPGALWVGMEKLVNNVFTWLDGSTYVWKWGSNQPSEEADQICVKSNHGELSNRRCTQESRAVCEIPL
ncbi:uncharacterized protein LOC124271340 [Haliotis rubra]|uniref:uncharacterized protein LOC124271340 n=1 Tax=Haliotis rubra TaxID=36100 RepID=UPI001EE60D44|nr:uncharacterized protein LOC124271340 [Haliotis rubra]